MFGAGRRIHPILLIAVFICVAVGWYLTGKVERDQPDFDQARRFLDSLLKQQVLLYKGHARVDLVAPDGEKAEAHPEKLGRVAAIGCPMTRQKGERTRVGTYYRSDFHCLYKLEGPEGLAFHIAAYVSRSEDPTLRTRLNGYGFRLMSAKSIRLLMTRLGVKTRAFERDEQKRLWDKLARLGFRVPADKARKEKDPYRKLLLDSLKRK